MYDISSKDDSDIDRKNTLLILGIDPGNNIGLCLMEVNTATWQILGVKYKTIKLSFRGNTISDKLIIVQDVIEKLFAVHNIDVMSIEKAFSNPQAPRASINLSKIITMSVMPVFHKKTLEVYEFEPKLVKKIFSDNGRSDKTDMFDSLLNHNILTDNQPMPDEHSVDAIAIAYCAYSTIKDRFNLKYY